MLATLFLAASLTLPEGNLLLGREAQGRGLSGAPAATDGLLAAEGSSAASAEAAGRAVRLADPNAYFAVDLGSPRPVGALLLQADAGDTYLVETSADGRSWTGILRIEPGDAAYGMRTRKAELPSPREARFLLVHAEGGDGVFAVGELAAFTQAPASWREPPPPAAAPESLSKDDLLVGLKGLIALTVALLLGWGVVLRRRGTPTRFAKIRDRALAGLGLLSAAAFFNFGLFHFGPFIHTWDSYHYVLGAKYFPELGYTGLYEATLAAERATGLLPPGSALPVRDLATNAIRISNADEALAVWQPRLGARWEAFVTDVLWFRTRTTPEEFRRILLDHGYNATPAWSILGSALARAVGPVTNRSVGLLALLDPLLLLGAWLFLWRAFGWRAACVALVFWGTNFPGRFYWNGGSFLRMDWLAVAMAGVALLKLGRPRLAGAALAFSTLLRIFPGALLLGLGLAAAWRLARERNLKSVREELLVAQGALLTALVVVPLSLLSAGGFSSVRSGAWTEFAQNSRKHLATPLANNVGLGTLVTWRPSTRGLALSETAKTEPWSAWKDAKHAALRDSRPLRLFLTAAFLGALAFAFRNRPGWAAAAAGAGLVFVLADLTCYYASILLLLGLLALEREETGIVTSLLAASTSAAPFLLRWEDDRSALVSALVLAAFALLLAILAWEEKRCQA